MARGKLGKDRRIGDRRQKMKRRAKTEHPTSKWEENEEAASSSSLSFRI
jgi:hypothetical protein